MNFCYFLSFVVFSRANVRANMENYSLNGVSANIFFDTRRAKNDTELYPVKYRVNYKGKRKLFPSGKDLSEETWNSYINPDKNTKQIKSLRQDLKIGFRNITDAIDNIFNERKPFSFELLDQMMGRKHVESLDDLFTEKINEQYSLGRVGNALAYSNAYKSIKDFHGKKTLMPNQITISFLNNYQKKMLEKGNSFSTIGLYLRELRAIMNIAKKSMIITEEEYPFGKDKFQIPKGDSQKKVLTKEQIIKLIEYPCKEGSLQQKYRDLWVFSYLGNGLNINDLCRLRFTDIDNGEIKFLRKKTILTSRNKKYIYVPIGTHLQTIIDRWSAKDKSGYIFPFLPKKCSPEKEKELVKKLVRAINQTMSRMGEKLGYGKISTYTARHSYATNLVKSGADPAYIGDTLGHTSLKSTEVYFAPTTPEERIKQSNKLLAL